MHGGALLRGMRPAMMLVVALLLAGCLEGDAGSSGAGSEAPLVASMDAFDERGGNRTMLVLREGEAAERLTYVADRSWLPRLAPGLTYPASELEALFATPPGGVERGGLVMRIERGRVDPAVLAQLQPFLDGAWPVATLPAEERHPWFQPEILARADPPAIAEVVPWVEDAPDPEAQRLMQLREVFGRLAASFEAEEVEEGSLPMPDGWDGCLRATTSLAEAAAVQGDVVEVRARVVNCGTTEVVLDPARCPEPPFATVHLGSGVLWNAALPSSDEPRAAYAIDGVCRDEGSVVRLAPGGESTLVRRWNGTVAACRAAEDCEYRPAEPSEYAFFTFVSGHDQAEPASLTLLPREGETVPLLVARESERMNGTTSERLQAEFGPHCAPVRYTTEPASVTLWYYGERPALQEGIVVRDWRGSPTPENVATFSADRLDVLHVPRNGTAISSPFERSGAPPLAEVRVEGDAFVVNGTRIEVGEVTTMEVTQTLATSDGEVEVTSVLELRNVGRAGVLYQLAGGCA